MQQDDDSSRLMPFLVGSRAAETTYSSVAQQPGSVNLAAGSAMAWPRKHPVPEQQDPAIDVCRQMKSRRLWQESEGPSYSKQQLLQLRPSILAAKQNGAHDGFSMLNSLLRGWE